MTEPSPASSASPALRVLVFSRTLGFRHESIPDGVAALRELARAHGFAVEATEDAAVFSTEGLRGYRAVVFLNTTGEVLDGGQQAAFQAYIRRGGGYAGVHSASDTLYEWPWYGRLVGAYFKRHPAVQQARLRVADGGHPSTRGLPDPWVRTDEWYDFRSDPRPNVRVLLSLDEGSYSGGQMGGDHPVAWCHAFEGGRAWYTALGHVREAYQEAAFRRHLLGGVMYAAGAGGAADC